MSDTASIPLTEITVTYPGISGNRIFPQVPIQKQPETYEMFIEAPEEKSAQVLMW